MKTILYIILMILAPSFVFAQETKLDIAFDHESSLKKFLVKQISVSESRSIPAREPYVHSITIRLTLDLEGEVIDLSFIEKAKDDDFNNMFERWTRSTSGKWKFNEIGEEVEQVYVIIPYLHRTPPDDRSKYPKDLEEQFTAYHNSLSYENIEGCDETNCVIWKQITNYTGTPVR